MLEHIIYHLVFWSLDWCSAKSTKCRQHSQNMFFGGKIWTASYYKFTWTTISTLPFSGTSWEPQLLLTEFPDLSCLLVMLCGWLPLISCCDVSCPTVRLWEVVWYQCENDIMWDICSKDFDKWILSKENQDLLMDINHGLVTPLVRGVVSFASFYLVFGTWSDEVASLGLLERKAFVQVCGPGESWKERKQGGQFCC